MSGKRTFVTDRRYIDAVWVAPLARAVDWPAIEDALRRPLAAIERDRITEALALHATFLAQAHAAKVTTQDIKRTLGALAQMDHDAARTAYARSDGWTQAQIASAMLHAGIRDGDALAQPSGEQIVMAARAAVGRIVGQGGRPAGAHVLLARAALQLWGDLGGKSDAAITTWDGSPSPLVAFGVTLFNAVQPLSGEQVRELLTSTREGFST